ncbi:MAG: glycoside hydrolase family 3 N-terminal domain-containing protein [Lachnospiraceae bacterium]
MECYKNPQYSPKERAEDLLSRMTLVEKVGQINQRLYGFQIYERKGEKVTLSQEFCDEVKHFGGLGVLYGLYRADPWSQKTEENGITPEFSKQIYNQVQEYVLRHSRLGIPMMMSSECPHGHQALEGTMLPVNLAVGCTFNPDLLEQAYASCGKQLQDGHVDFALMSVLDVMRDPRWGRSEECYSEDPYLSSKLAAAAVRGMQSSGVIAVAKHLCAQGEGTGGINASAARIGERELREIHLPSMEACCKEGVKGVMAAYNEIDGVFCHANPYLLKHILREEMGFEGIVMADGLAIDNLRNLTGNKEKAGVLARKSGVDISLWDKGFSLLDKAVEDGLIDEEEIDEAVLRVLELKFERGLFEHPYMDSNMKAGSDYGTDELSEKIAEESVVLLKNDNQFLPLDVHRFNKEHLHPVKKIAVIGPNANDRYRQMGDYTPPVAHEKSCTVWEGMRQLSSDGMEVCFSKGCDVLEGSQQEREQAVALARDCDAIVLVLGGSSSRYEGVSYDANGAANLSGGKIAMECGEGMDVSDLQLPLVQRELFDALIALQKPIVTVVIAGRAYAIPDIVKKSTALLYAPYPGPWGGLAIAKVLYGLCAPQGRLAFSIPASSAQLPVYYNYKSSYVAMNYCNERRGVLYRFGEGLSYSTFSYHNIHLSVGEEPHSYCLQMTITNEGDYAAAAVPQLYIRRLEASTTRRVRELKNFQKIYLQPKESKSVQMVLTEDCFKLWNYEMKYVFEPGKVVLELCDNQEIWHMLITVKM